MPFVLGESEGGNQSGVKAKPEAHEPRTLRRFHGTRCILVSVTTVGRFFFIVFAEMREERETCLKTNIRVAGVGLTSKLIKLGLSPLAHGPVKIDEQHARRHPLSRTYIQLCAPPY